MTSTQALSLASDIDSEVAGKVLLLINAAFNAKGDPMAEKMILDVERLLYSRTEHSEEALLRFISEAESDSSHLAA